MILDTNIDFVQMTLAFLYAFCCLVFLNAHYQFFKSYPLNAEINYLRIIQDLDPLIYSIVFFLLWFLLSLDGLNLRRKHQNLRIFYLIGPFLWLYFAVGVFLDFGLILTVGVYLYLFSHSTWLYFRY